MEVKAGTSSNAMKKSQPQQIPSTVYFDHCLICNRICYLPETVSPDELERVAVVRQVFYSVYDIPASPQTIASLKDEIPLCSGCLIKIGRLRELRDLLAQIQRDFNNLKEGIAFDVVDVVAKCEKGVASAGMDYGWRDVPQESVRQCLFTAEVDTLQQIIFDDWHERHPTDQDPVNDSKHNGTTSTTVESSTVTPPTITKVVAPKKDEPIFRTPFPPKKRPSYGILHHQQNQTNKKCHPVATRPSFQLISPPPSRITQNMSKKLVNSNMFGNKKVVASPPNLSRVGVGLGIGGKSYRSALISNRSSLPNITANSNKSKFIPTQQQQSLSTSSTKTTVISITTSAESRKGNGGANVNASSGGSQSILKSSSPSFSSPNPYGLKRKLSQDNESVTPNLNATSTKSIEILVGEGLGSPTKKDRRISDLNSEMVVSISPSTNFRNQLTGEAVEDDLDDSHYSGISVTKVESEPSSNRSAQNGDGSQKNQRPDELFDDASSEEENDDEPDPFLLDEYGDIGLGDFLEGGGGQLEELDDDEIDTAGDQNTSSLNATGIDEDDGEITDSEKKCTVGSSYVESLIAHLQSGEGEGGVGNVEFLQNEEGLYVCMFCSKTFIHKYPYRDHLKTHTGEGPKCPICFKIFPKNHNLMLHLRTHTGEKPFSCDVCLKGFADKSNLKVHYRVHTGERPYKCEYCDQAFVNSSRLVVHRRVHTGEKPTKPYPVANQLQKAIHDDMLETDDSVSGRD